MKIKKLPIAALLTFIIMLSGCSREEDTFALPVQDDKSYLSFNILFNDLAGKLADKQTDSVYPNCPPGSPVYIEIILSMGDVYVAGTDKAPLRIELSPGSRDTNGDGVADFFTKEVSALELAPGTYTLEYLNVLDADENTLWIAPVKEKQSASFAQLVSRALPMDIYVGKGVKKYQDVEVICFEDESLDDESSITFEVNGIQLNEFCIFGSYCDENGRHAEFILFKSNVWEYSGDPLDPKGQLLHEDLQNEVIVTDYEDYAETQSFPLCFTLPDGPGVDEYYIEITQINLGAEDVLIRSGLISDEDVKDLFNEDGTLEYYHFFEGECGIEDEPMLLNDPRDIIGSWEFTFVFGGDAIVSADVVFYTDGTASYSDYWTAEEPLQGTWSYLNHTLFYYPDGDNDMDGYYNFSGRFIEEGILSGTSWQGGFQNEWSAVRKD